MPARLYGNGYLVVGDAAGFLLHLGVLIRGVDFAMESGNLAAEAVVKAHDEGRYDEETLSVYWRLLNESFILKEFRTFRNAHKVLNNPRLYSDYVMLVNSFMARYFDVDGTPRRIWDTFMSSKGKLTLTDMVRDALSLVRNL
jgi:electron transfer flavoprotein-quinone oxidoreductase